MMTATDTAGATVSGGAVGSLGPDGVNGWAGAAGWGTGEPLALLTLALLLERPMTARELAEMARQRAEDSPVCALTPTEAEFARAAVELRHAAMTCGHPAPGRDAHVLTDRGRATFRQRVCALLGVPDDAQPSFHTAVGYLGALDCAAAVAALQARVPVLRERAARIDAALVGGAGIPRLFLIENEYALRMCRAELEWVEQTLENIASGALVWPHVEVTENGWEWHRDSGSAI
jgi:hypothetical protein